MRTQKTEKKKNQKRLKENVLYKASWNQLELPQVLVKKLALCVVRTNHRLRLLTLIRKIATWKIRSLRNHLLQVTMMLGSCSSAERRRWVDPLLPLRQQLKRKRSGWSEKLSWSSSRSKLRWKRNEKSKLKRKKAGSEAQPRHAR